MFPNIVFRSLLQAIAAPNVAEGDREKSERQKYKNHVLHCAVSIVELPRKRKSRRLPP